jgi:hypothetical protein
MKGLVFCDKCRMFWVVSDIENADKCLKDGRHRKIRKSVLRGK